jgi:hypothetical protein
MPIQAGTYTKPKKEIKSIKVEKTDDEPRQKREKKPELNISILGELLEKMTKAKMYWNNTDSGIKALQELKKIDKERYDRSIKHLVKEKIIISEEDFSRPL